MLDGGQGIIGKKLTQYIINILNKLKPTIDCKIMQLQSLQVIPRSCS